MATKLYVGNLSFNTTEEELRQAFAAFLTKNVLVVAALAAHVHGHVFNQPQHRHIHLLEHGDAFFGIEQRDVLRCGDDDSTRERHFLRHGELNVARAGGHIDDEVVQAFPARLVDELL